LELGDGKKMGNIGKQPFGHLQFKYAVSTKKG